MFAGLLILGVLVFDCGCVFLGVLVPCWFVYVLWLRSADCCDVGSIGCSCIGVGGFVAADVGNLGALRVCCNYLVDLGWGCDLLGVFARLLC